VNICKVFVNVHECLQVFVGICERLCMNVDLVRWSPDTERIG
jgi:hypothetical protein